MEETKNRKKIVCIGGGTGTSVVLFGLKKYPVDLSVVVAMSDSGGSNKVIRDEFGLLPTSDIRQCLIVLADSQEGSADLLRQLFVYRFHQAEGIKGNTFGNLFMAALTDILSSQKEAIKKTGEILRIKGRILPVTYSDSNLVGIFENGMKVVGEHEIDMPEHDGSLKIDKLYLEPESKANPEAVEAILEADLVVIGPGDLYTSLVPNFLVKGIKEALTETKAKKVFVLNLMTRYGQTYGYSAKNHIEDLEKYIGKIIDFILVNSKKMPFEILKQYEEEKAFPVEDNLEKDYFDIIRDDMLSEQKTKKVDGDIVQRSLIRHDSEKVAKTIINLL